VQVIKASTDTNGVGRRSADQGGQPGGGLSVSVCLLVLRGARRGRRVGRDPPHRAPV